MGKQPGEMGVGWIITAHQLMKSQGALNKIISTFGISVFRRGYSTSEFVVLCKPAPPCWEIWTLQQNLKHQQHSESQNCKSI